MLEKYRATIQGSTIKWNGEEPTGVRNDEVVEVYVTIVDSVSGNISNGERAAAALQKIADHGGVESIPNPDKWLRAIRKDRPLPGRD